MSILKLAVSADALSPQLATLLALQRAEEPETAIQLHEVATRDLVRGLEDGAFDIGMTLATTATVFAMNTQSLWADELALAVPLGSPLLASAEVSLGTLRHHPLLRWCQGACDALSQQVDRLFGPEERSALEATSFELMTVLVAAGYCAAIAPRSRIMLACGWGVAMRQLAGGPYLISTQLLRLSHGAAPAVERFAERAAKITETRPD